MLSDIQDKPFIAPINATYLGAMFHHIFAQCDVIPHIIAECQNIETAHMMAVLKTGICLIPEMYIKDISGSGDMKYYIIEDMPLTRDIAVVYRNDNNHSDICSHLHY
jgi:DNA-binding transcriptional LysR family regulator